MNTIRFTESQFVQAIIEYEGGKKYEPINGLNVLNLLEQEAECTLYPLNLIP